jgi:hypothetical protein
MRVYHITEDQLYSIKNWSAIINHQYERHLKTPKSKLIGKTLRNAAIFLNKLRDEIIEENIIE